MVANSENKTKETVVGNPNKDAEYLARIKKAISDIPEHPRHHGVKMQAHHLISAEGVKRSGVGPFIKKYGYNINLLPNLAFIPCTLQGACYLGVQPHRGNHTFPIERPVDQDHYDDDLEPLTYHDLVAHRLTQVEKKMQSECPGNGKIDRKQIVKEIDKLSEWILSLIQIAPTKAPLSKLARYYAPGSEVGCGNVDSVRLHRGHVCSSKRNHINNQQAESQSKENISYVINGRYVLKPGR